MIYALDALFGLPRKKAAGVSYKAPLLGPLFFGDQTSVDQFVAESKKAKPLSTVSINIIHIQWHLIFLHRHAVTLQQEICFEVQVGIMLLTKLQCLGVPAVMIFLFIS